MKQLALYIIFPFLIIFQQKVFAQQNAKLYNDSLFNKLAQPGNGFNTTGNSYYIAQWINELPAGIKVIRKLSDKTAIVKIDNKNSFDFLKQKIKISPVNNLWKLSPALEKHFAEKSVGGYQKFIITGLSVNALLQTISGYSRHLSIITVNKPSQSVVIKTTAKLVKQYLLPLNEIIFIDNYIEPKTEVAIIGYDRSFDGINVLDFKIPGANGKNIVTGIKEQKMDENDLDLYKRVLPSPIEAPTTDAHATVMASIIGGAGNSFYSGRGIANHCKFFSSSFSNLFADEIAILNENKVTVQNHSYGTIVQQFYGAEAVSYDEQTWRNKNFVHVFSAGNVGSSVATEGKYANLANYANLTGNFKMAKNVITVGAVERTGIVATQSSAGPLYDGRLAPQLTALGPNGTSDASAVVTGTVAVLQQVYADSNAGALPPASLLKAVMYNTADDIYLPGIDYKTGYGLVNSYEAVRALQQRKYDSGIAIQGIAWTKNITIPFTAAQLRITLSWTDTVASVNNNKALINDLDLEVKSVNNSIVYKPWVLSATAQIDSLARPAERRRDSLNTAEQVSIALPPAGTYQLSVKGTAITSGEVPFNIAYNIDTLNTFTFTNPLHASDVNREEDPDLTIKWKTFVADSASTGDLYISYNRGTDWQLLQQNIKINNDQYVWPVKDTNSTGLFKMETGIGTFLSNEFIISKVIRPRVDFFCTDSFRVSWDQHVYAESYKIYAFTDSPYLKPIVSTNDTFKIFKRSEYPFLIYAVEPILTNHLPAARSAALNITTQGVHCFYNTLNYELLDSNNVKLILEIGAPEFIDSIYFEQVSASGTMLQVYGSEKVSGNTTVFNQSANNLTSGVTYFRARIKLKSGGIVYTDVISVLTSGRQQIVFYPNPVNGNDLSYVLKQGTFADSKLKIYDMTGRLIKDFSSLPEKINMSGFPAGIYVYKLISVSDKILTTGKIVVTR